MSITMTWPQMWAFAIAHGVVEDVVNQLDLPRFIDRLADSDQIDVLEYAPTTVIRSVKGCLKSKATSVLIGLYDDEDEEQPDERPLHERCGIPKEVWDLVSGDKHGKFT